MGRKIFVLMGGILAGTWGVAHIIPTSSVVKGFGNISADNIRIITMEWINEGLTLIFIGLLVTVVTLVRGSDSKVSRVVYLVSFFMLVVMSVLSLFTGFKVAFLPFRLCPIIFTISGLLIFQGIFTGKKEHT